MAIEGCETISLHPKNTDYYGIELSSDGSQDSNIESSRNASDVSFFTHDPFFTQETAETHSPKLRIVDRNLREIESKPLTGGFLQEYMSKSLGWNTDNFYLFPLHKAARITAASAAFYKDFPLRILRSDESCKVTTVEQGKLVVETDSRDVILDFHQVVADFDALQADEHNFRWTRGMSEPEIQANLRILLHANIASKPIYQLARPGDYLEIINYKDPTQVDSAEIVQNRGGLLEVKYLDGKRETLHFCSPRCKPIGWAHTFSEEQFQPSGRYSYPAGSPCVPKFCFDVFAFEITSIDRRFFTLSKLDIKENVLLAVIDPTTQYRILPAVVTRIFNDYFAEVTIIENVEKNAPPQRTLNVCSASPELFPFNCGHLYKFNITVPNGLDSDKVTVEAMSKALQRKLTSLPVVKFCFPSMEGMLVPKGNADVEDEEVGDHGAAFESAAGFHMVSRHVGRGRHLFQRHVAAQRSGVRLNVVAQNNNLTHGLVELFIDGNYGVLHIGRILKATKHLLTISIETFEKFINPRIMSITDPNIFPLGFAIENNIDLFAPSLVVRPNALAVNILDEFTMDVIEKNKYYVPEAMFGMEWSPKIYVNKKCFFGPYIDARRLWRIGDVYGPAPIKYIFASLITALTSLTSTKRIQKLLTVANLTDELPSARAKFVSLKSTSERRVDMQRFTYPALACRGLEDVPIYLHLLCRLIDACPGFLSLEKSEDAEHCPYGCSKVDTEYFFMKPDKHLRTAFAFGKPQVVATKKRRTLAERLKLDTPPKYRLDRDPADRPLRGKKRRLSDHKSPPGVPKSPVKRIRPMPIISRPALITRPSIMAPSSLSVNQIEESESSTGITDEDEDDVPQLENEREVAAAVAKANAEAVKKNDVASTSTATKEGSAASTNQASTPSPETPSPVAPVLEDIPKLVKEPPPAKPKPSSHALKVTRAEFAKYDSCETYHYFLKLIDPAVAEQILRERLTGKDLLSMNANVLATHNIRFGVALKILSNVPPQ